MWGGVRAGARRLPATAAPAASTRGAQRGGGQQREAHKKKDRRNERKDERARVSPRVGHYCYCGVLPRAQPVKAH